MIELRIPSSKGISLSSFSLLFLTILLPPLLYVSISVQNIEFFHQSTKYFCLFFICKQLNKIQLKMMFFFNIQKKRSFESKNWPNVAFCTLVGGEPYTNIHKTWRSEKWPYRALSWCTACLYHIWTGPQAAAKIESSQPGRIEKARNEKKTKNKNKKKR